MKSVIQSYRTGRLSVSELPEPTVRAGGVVVANVCSLVSAGTERQMVELAQKSIVGKARERPDLVRRVLEKTRQDGLVPTIDAVLSRLEKPIPLGYSSAGIVVEVGEDGGAFQPGDRVACAGAGYATHSEHVFVPRHLVTRLPDTVSFEAGAFTTLGAIALQGARLAPIELGETVAVIGLGLIGLLAVQIARAAGCRVGGFDPDRRRAELARELGATFAGSDAEDLVDWCGRSAGGGADKVLICASTPSSSPVELAARLARDRATVVVIGATGTAIPHRAYFEKELTLRVSRSYGPGRYDPEYEEKGRDYPIGYVRWTENRNMEAFVDLLADYRVDTAKLISHRFDIAEASRAYELITAKTDEPSLGIVLAYPTSGREVRRQAEEAPPSLSAMSAPTIGVVGAGQFATGTLIPAIKRAGLRLGGVCAASSISAEAARSKFGFAFAATDEKKIIGGDAAAVVIATRHRLHARQVIAALEHEQHVFCEKPLCISEDELEAIIKAKALHPRALLMVGYNRRFAPMTLELADHFGGSAEVINCRVNAGFIPLTHWTQDAEQGGGRVIGELCHFVDLVSFIAGAIPVRVHARALRASAPHTSDNVIATFELANGAIASITYVANGDRALGKERLEVFGGSRAAVLDNFRELSLMRKGRTRTRRARLSQDKGHVAEWRAFSRAIHDGGPAPIDFESIVATSRACFAVLESLQSGSLVSIHAERDER